MDKELVQSMNSPTNADPTKGNACWETPPDVFAALHAEFKFDIDLTGGPGTQHRLPRWFGPGSMFTPDALTASWYFIPTVHQQQAGGILSHATVCGFSNPPYGKFIPLIMEKAYRESAQGFTSVFLLPNRVTRWYKNAMRHASEIRIVDERIAFWEDGHPRWNAKILRETGAKVPDPAMFDSCIVVVRPPTDRRQYLFTRAQFDIWHWDPDRLKRCRLTAA